MCDSFVLSHFNFCDAVYGPCITAETSYRIQKVQNCCLRFIHGIRRGQHISHTLPLTKWTNMEKRRHFHIANLYHKIIINRQPSYLYRKITFRTDVHNVNIRFKGTLTPPVFKTEHFKCSFSYNIAYVFNSLPRHLKNCSVAAFTRLYRKHFYTFE